MWNTHLNESHRTVADLQARIRSLERGTLPGEATLWKTDCPALNALFPMQGIRQGSLIEWIEGGPASGAGTLSLLTGQQVCSRHKPFIAIDQRQQVYPLSLATLGFDLSRVVIVRPSKSQDALWACEESLRSGAAGIVWSWHDHLSPTAARRLRLAAEASSSVCFLVRPPKALRQPSWAEARLLVEPRYSQEESPRYRVSVTYSQGKPLRSVTDIQIDRHQGTIDELSPASAKNSLSLVS